VNRLLASILIALAVVSCPLVALSQPATKTFRVGYLGSDPPPYTYFEAFRAGLRRLGYVEGQNIIVEGRHADGRADRLPTLASELAGLKLDVIVAAGGPATQAARRRAVRVRWSSA
jgi:putative ABC transport system substrate-binding protein